MIRFLLWPLAFLFFLLSQLRYFLFSVGVLKRHKVEPPVLCIGNLTTGGTGKTPWVQKVSQFFHERGSDVAILSRGYTGDYNGVLRVEETMDARRCGDEPLWLKANTSADVVVGRNRANAAQWVLNERKPDLFVLDDGFQHFALERDFNLILLDASVSRSHYHLLPVGQMREGFSGLRRAHAVVINKCNYANQNQVRWLTDRCLPFLAKDRIFYADFVFSHWVPMVSELDWTVSLDQASMTCGVGNPDAFLKTLEQQGVQPVKEFIFPDHYFWKPADVERMTYNMKREGSRDLMITEKDAVKLNRFKKHFKEMGIQLWVCKMKVELLERSSEFDELLEGVLR